MPTSLLNSGRKSIWRKKIARIEFFHIPQTDWRPSLKWMGVIITGVSLGLFIIHSSSLSSQWMPLISIAVMFPFILSIIQNTRKVLLALILLDIPLQLDYYIGYEKETVGLGAIIGYGISITTICLVILYGMWLSELLIKSRAGSKTSLKGSQPLILYLYLGFVSLSLFTARNVTYSSYELFMLIQIFLLYLYIVKTVRNRQDVLFIITMLFISLILESMIMIFLLATGQSFSIAGISGRINAGTVIPGQVSRIAGTLGSPNTAASYLSILLAPSLSILKTNLARSYKLLGALAFCLGTIGLISTFSRGGWIAYVISISLLVIVAWLNGRLTLKLPLTIILVLTAAFLLFSSTINERLTGNDMGSAYSRIPQYELAFRIINDHPLLGIGANNYGLVIKEYEQALSKDVFFWAVHNKYLLVWAETGIGGLLTFLFFIVTAIRYGWLTWKANHPFLSPIALGFSAAIIGQMAHMLFDVFHSRPQVQLLWVIAGLLLALNNILKEEKDGSRTDQTAAWQYPQGKKE